MHIVPNFFNIIKTQRFKSDNARDYFNNTLVLLFQQEGITPESSCINTPQQNGLAEKKNRHLLDMTLAMLFHKHVPNPWFSSNCHRINFNFTKQLAMPLTDVA